MCCARVALACRCSLFACAMAWDASVRLVPAVSDARAWGQPRAAGWQWSCIETTVIVCHFPEWPWPDDFGPLCTMRGLPTKHVVCTCLALPPACCRACTTAPTTATTNHFSMCPPHQAALYV